MRKRTCSIVLLLVIVLSVVLRVSRASGDGSLDGLGLVRHLRPGHAPEP